MVNLIKIYPPLLQQIEKSEQIKCLTYIFDDKIVNEETNGKFEKKVKPDLKLFIGTNESNIYCFQLEDFLQSKIRDNDIERMKIEFTQRAKQNDLYDNYDDANQDEQQDQEQNELRKKMEKKDSNDYLKQLVEQNNRMVEQLKNYNPENSMKD